jgi:Protein of unknown function (DUF4238)
MAELKKRQHYVWRKYLRAWADKEKIWSFLKDQNKVIKPDLMGVAQEKYFYELIEFTDDEEKLLKEYIEKTSHKSVRELNLDFFRAFTAHYKLRRNFNIIDERLNPEQRKEIEEKIREFEVNMMEDSHGIFENLGTKLTNCRSLEDLNLLNDPDEYYNALMFLTFQYLRTKKRKIAIIRSFKGEKFPAEKFWNIISHVMATNIARNLSFDPNLRIRLFENFTNENFITNDQPIFNICDEEDENGNVINLELYYPLSPNHAILIHFDTQQKTKLEEIKITESVVKYFNELMIQNAEQFIFANNENQLLALIT